MKVAFVFFALLAALTLATAQEATDPAFEPPMSQPGSDSQVRWNGTLGMVIMNGKVYQQFGLRPDIPFGKFGVGLDLTFRFDADGNFKKDEWNTGRAYVEKIYYVRYGQPGDPFYARAGALDNVTLGYGMIMRRYSNTIQYPEVKRIGFYTEGGVDGYSWQAMLNSVSELDQPGLMAARLSYDTGLQGLTVGATVAHDGNQFAGLTDKDHDGVPDRLDLFPNRNDFRIRDQLLSSFHNDTTTRDYLIDNGFLPDFRKAPVSYNDIKESVTEFGADAGFPLVKGSKFSVWTYAQIAKIARHGWGWSFPGARMQVGPLTLSGEYRQYGKEFRGEFFNFTYELERAQLQGDSLFITKEKALNNLGSAKGFFGDALISIQTFGYLYGWYEDMHGAQYHDGKTLYGELGVTPPQVTRMQKLTGYYMQPNVHTLLNRVTEGTIYGAKLYFALARNVSLVYDHRITYYNGQNHRTVRVETMVSF
ncbi:MAG TPA: hypothetical protein VGL38_03270 [bacterium]|jgi:hypothetical protein